MPALSPTDTDTESVYSVRPKALRPVATWLTGPEPDATRAPPLPSLTPVRISQVALVGVNPESVLMKAIVAPGLLLQALTTRYPDESQMEVAIASMEELLKREGDLPQSSVAPSAA